MFAPDRVSFIISFVYLCGCLMVMLETLFNLVFDGLY